MSSKDSYTIEEILALLEEDDLCRTADIYMGPPENHMNSDEDSGEEDDSDINHLCGSQLRAFGEATVTRVTEFGVEEVLLGGNDEPIDDLENTTQFRGNNDTIIAMESTSSISDVLSIAKPSLSSSPTLEPSMTTKPKLLSSHSLNSSTIVQPIASSSLMPEPSMVTRPGKSSSPILEPSAIPKPAPSRPTPLRSNNISFVTVNDAGETNITNGNDSNKSASRKPKRKLKMESESNVSDHKKSKKIENKPNKKINPKEKIKQMKNKEKSKGKKPSGRVWVKTDIPGKPEREWQRPNFLDNDMTPVQIFELFWDDNVIDLVVQETNSYALEKGAHSFQVSRDEIRVFIGILLLSGYCTVSRRRLYWDTGSDTYHSGIAKTISRNRFEDILRYFHVSNNATLDREDKFTKIRPLFTAMNANWLKYFPQDRYISIDESMVPYYGRHGAKQHLHGKPIRFGYKVWSMCSRLGYLIQAEPYQGAKTGNTNPNLGVGGSVVMSLIEKLPNDGGFSIFFDNFFTSLSLFDELRKNGHDGTGTIRANRTSDAPILDKKTAKQMPRGGYFQTTDTKSGTTLIQYHDNNVVIVASNKCGVSPVGTCKRWSSIDKKHILIQQPCCISQYNNYMGGVDRLDQNVSAYRISIRMKKWYWPLLMFLLNASINNAYQLYRLTPSGKDKGSLDFLGFIRIIVQTYMALNAGQRPSVGRTRKPVKKRVPDDLRLDGKNHFVVSSATQVRCGQCHKNTTKKCSKCNVGCHVNCFVEFHK